MKQALHLLFILMVFCSSLRAWTQDAPQSSAKSYFDIGIKTGSFLPYEIQGVTELLPFFGVKLAHSVSQTLGLEYDIDMAHAKGVQYFNGYFSLRHDFSVGNVVPMIFLLGVDGHYYKRAPIIGSITGQVTEFDYQFSTGWHAGFGSETVVYGDIWIRGDVKMGFSPGRHLTVSIIGIYRF